MCKNTNNLVHYNGNVAMKKKIRKSTACQFQKAMLKSVNISHAPMASVCPAAGELQSVR